MSLLSPLIAIGVGLGSRPWSKLDRSVFMLVSLSFGSDVLAYMAAKILHNNYIILHLFQVAELIILGILFQRILRKKWAFFALTTFAVLYIVDLVLRSDLNINPIIVSLKCLVVILLCIYAYYQLYAEEEFESLALSPKFWYITGLIGYFSGALFSWSLFSFVHQNDGSGLGIWIFHNISNILKNLLIAIGLWKARTA